MWEGLTCLIVSLPFLGFGLIPIQMYTFIDIGYLAAANIFVALAYILFTLAFKYDIASKLCPFYYV